MPLLGRAAMLLTFDIAPEAVAEHDDWHTHEHLPERLAIPGFLRGTRWVADGEGTGYCVLYEVAQLETLASPAYLERLNHPSPWTQKMMPHYRGMTRGLCEVAHSHGLGAGHFGLLVRFKPAGEAAAALDAWLGTELLPRITQQPGLGSAHLLRSGMAAAMTSEQRIRGADAGVDWAVLVTGYQREALQRLAQGELGPAQLAQRGAAGVLSASYRSAYTLAAAELLPARG
ncbi:MAG TPA: hypothetical protein VFL64_14680 [Rhizobacter sp.]|nr:hypothetical protein [Rhizobacter sp.]